MSGGVGGGGRVEGRAMHAAPVEGRACVGGGEE